MKKSNKSIVVIGVFLGAVLLSIRLINSKREEVYELDSIVNLQEIESKRIAILYKDSDNEEYKDTDTIPKGNYEVDTNESYCTNGTSKGHINPTPTMEYKENKVYIKADSSSLKCFVYLKKVKEPTAEDTLVELNLTPSDEKACPILDVEGNANIKAMSQSSDNLLCKGNDDYGETYYFRGNVDKNWVKIGSTYWRIIRINGNGSIRLIYSGDTGPVKTGTGTIINGKSYVFNSYYDNKYVGYMYGTKSDSYVNAHKNENKSSVLIQVENWYNGTGDFISKGKGIAEEYRDKIDGTTGFCGDRTIAKNKHGSDYNDTGYGSGATNKTAYGPADRIWTKSGESYNGTQKATFKCEDQNDLYTVTNDEKKGNQALPVPVGLITSDEVIYAGGFAGATNGDFWLCSGAYYWTISPSHFNGSGAQVFVVYNTGYLANYYSGVDWSAPGVRPVINLKAGTKFTIDGAGTSGEAGSSTNPYVVQLS